MKKHTTKLSNETERAHNNNMYDTNNKKHIRKDMWICGEAEQDKKLQKKR